ncbi:MAG: hypothetical protein WAM90_10460, partial [Rhodanobacter sp.]
GWPAWQFAAGDGSISQLWIWQPIVSGSSYLAELHRLDEAERALRADYPFCRQLGSYREDSQLVGYACPDALHSEIMAAEFPSQPLPGHTVLGVLADGRIGDIPGHTTQRIDLPESRTHWKDTLEVRATFLTRDLHEPIDRLTAILGTPRAIA